MHYSSSSTSTEVLAHESWRPGLFGAVLYDISQLTLSLILRGKVENLRDMGLLITGDSLACKVGNIQRTSGSAFGGGAVSSLHSSYSHPAAGIP